MSKTTKQLGSPEGTYCCDPSEFSNPGQVTSGFPNNDGHNVRPATAPQFTQTAGNDRADGVVKDSARPHVGSLSGANAGGNDIRSVVVEPRSGSELKGR
jgi:hypothetical protein